MREERRTRKDDESDGRSNDDSVTVYSGTAAYGDGDENYHGGDAIAVYNQSNESL